MRGLSWQGRLVYVGAVVLLCAPSAEGCSGDDGDDLPSLTGVATTTVTTGSSSSSGDFNLCACVQAVYNGVGDDPCEECYTKLSEPGRACFKEYQACLETEYCNDPTSSRGVPKCLIDCKGDPVCEWACLTWDGYGDGGGGSGGFYANGDPVGSPESIAKLKSYMACACPKCATCVPTAPKSCVSGGAAGAGGAGGAGGGM